MRHLRPVIDDAVIWDDTKIEVGSEWQHEIEHALDTCKVAILLISPSFLASKFIVDQELPRILEAARARGVIVLPVHISPTAYEAVPGIAEFQSVNPPSQTLSSLPRAKREHVLVEIARTVRSVLQGPPPSRPSPEFSSSLADDIANKVFQLMKPGGGGGKSGSGGNGGQDNDSKLVFVIISFSPDMEPIFQGIRDAANEVGLEAKRVKDVQGDYRITNKIMDMIAESRMVVADLTHERPNVYFELGYARGIGKTVITCAREETNIHFDVTAL